MKNSFYFLVILIAYFEISCSNYRYVTKKYDEVYYLTSKDIPDIKDYEYSIVDTLTDGNYHVREFTKDSIIRNDYYRNSETPRIGEYKIYYSNGRIKHLFNYNKKGETNGELKTFFENGNIKRLDIYKNNKFVSGTTWDINGKEIDYHVYDKEPGVDMGLLSKSLVYPEILRRKKIEEKVLVKLLIDSTGIPLKFVYDKNNSIEFVLEIARVIKNYGKFTPAIEDGIPIKCWVTIPVNFRLRD